ncbi:MAG: glycosyltransferase family 2 protein [Erythrobacter sp.]|nr:glycosyltransferase family 2 protein [Erythrobacter sp.]
MPTFNRADYIAQSVETILSQMSDEDELVVIDDGSTDATEAALAPYQDSLSYERQENAGKSAALNRALGCTDGKFVWICDDDDLLRPGVVDLMVAAIESGGFDMVFGRYTRFRIENGAWAEMGTGYWPDLSEGSIARHILEDAFVMHNASLVRRSAYEKVGPFDPRMLRSQDYEMFVRLALNGSIQFVDEVIFDQRKHEGARGPATIKHSVGKSEHIWQKYDALIFDRFTSDIPLGFFEGMFRSELPNLRTRAAQLQRATILARHGLWDAALSDWATSTTVAPDQPMTREEKAIVWRALAGKHGFGGLLGTEPMARLKALPGPFGHEIRREVSDGLLWGVRSPEKDVRDDARAFLNRTGWIGPVARWIRRRVGLTPALPDHVVEVSSVEPLPR